VAERRHYVVIGNGIAGTTAAETLRKNDADCEISLFTNEPYPLYNRVALPPYLKAKTTQSKVMMKTADAHRERNICFHPNTTVTAVDLEARTVRTEPGDEVRYDRLLVASGGRPNPLDVPGATADGVCYFQTLDDTNDLLDRILRAKSAVAVGGSYISYELAEGFRERGLEVAWLIRGPHFLHRVLDEDGGLLVDKVARHHGVRMVYGDTADHVETAGNQVAAVVTKGGLRLDADILGCGLGLTYNDDFLPPGAVKKKSYGLLTNEFLETNVDGVYAAGDIAEFYDVDVEAHYNMGTWASATTHGKVVAGNMAGAREPVREVRLYTTTLFDSRMTVVGATPEVREGIESVAHTDFGGKNPRDWSYRRLFFFEKRLVGAALIGDMRAKVDLVKVIRARNEVWDDRAALLRL
jgi:NAD(P)H-nitrite reductase large subunit